RTHRGAPKKKMIFQNEWGRDESIPYTGAGACGWECIVERVLFRASYTNINRRNQLHKVGLYIRGLVGENSRTGGYAWN
ncbi:MAG: hypothetical protein QMD05_06620, partial [Candidatus Brocadiaceae bacterium]|nr:hypothetical protein [Candidatus Brocadiaceae bacterium]